jgi:hypothetical protein
MSTDRIEKRTVLRAPVSRVWRALTDTTEFARWFGFTLEGPFTPGKTMRGTFDRQLDEAAIIEAQKRMRRHRAPAGFVFARSANGGRALLASGGSIRHRRRGRSRATR